MNGDGTYAVHEVTSADVAAWMRMRSRLWPEADREELLLECQSFVQGTNPLLCVAYLGVVDADPAGFIELNLRPYAEGAIVSPVPHVEGWYVDERHRRRGIGAALMRAAELWARNHGFTEMTSDTTEAYPDSIAAHASAGFNVVERLITFHKPLA